MSPRPWNAITHKSLPSTQSYLKDRWQGLPDRTCVVAEAQTAGQGREQRPWFSEVGGLYFSILLKPETVIEHLPWRIWLNNLEVLETVSEKRLQLKAPNDILCDQRKLSGTLIDGSIQGGKVNFYIIGVGINISNAFPDHLEACNLKALLGSAPNKNEVLNLWLSSLTHALELTTEAWNKQVRDRHMQRSVQMGYQDPHWINLEEYWNVQ